MSEFQLEHNWMYYGVIYVLSSTEEGGSKGRGRSQLYHIELELPDFPAVIEYVIQGSRAVSRIQT
jgi:hypothetical protein